METTAEDCLAKWAYQCQEYLFSTLPTGLPSGSRWSEWSRGWEWAGEGGQIKKPMVGQEEDERSRRTFRGINWRKR